MHKEGRDTSGAEQHPWMQNGPSPDRRSSIPQLPRRDIQRHGDTEPVRADAHVAHHAGEVAKALNARYCRERIEAFPTGGRSSLKLYASMLCSACGASSNDPYSIVDDIVFMLVHQILCIALSDPAKLPEKVLEIPNFDTCRRLLVEIILPGGVDKDRLEYAAHFADFPARQDVLTSWEKCSDAMVEALGFIFLCKFPLECVRYHGRSSSGPLNISFNNSLNETLLRHP